MALRIKPLYVVSATMGLCAAFWTVANRPRQEYFSPKETAELGFASQGQMEGIMRLLEQRRITSLSGRDEAVVRGAFATKKEARKFAVGVMSNLVGYELQSRFLPEAEEFLRDHAGNPLGEALLDGWLERDGLRAVSQLASSGDPKVRAQVKDALARHKGKRGDTKAD